jgi:hypothetical protein
MGALSGFWAGFNEEQNHLSSKKAASDISAGRALQNQQMSVDLDKQSKAQGILSNIFQGQLNPDDPNLGGKFDAASNALMGVDPKLGMQFAQQSLNMSQADDVQENREAQLANQANASAQKYDEWKAGQARLQVKQQSLDDWRRERLRQMDEKAASSKAGINKPSQIIPSEKDVQMGMANMPEEYQDLDPKEQMSLATQAMAGVKSRLAAGEKEGNFTDMFAEELDNATAGKEKTAKGGLSIGGFNIGGKKVLQDVVQQRKDLDTIPRATVVVKGQPTQVYTPTTKAEYDKLPSGALFKDDQGVKRKL